MIIETQIQRTKGRVCLIIKTDDGESIEIDMPKDEAREVHEYLGRALAELEN